MLEMAYVVLVFVFVFVLNYSNSIVVSGLHQCSSNIRFMTYGSLHSSFLPGR